MLYVICIYIIFLRIIYLNIFFYQWDFLSFNKIKSLYKKNNCNMRLTLFAHLTRFGKIIINQM